MMGFSLRWEIIASTQYYEIKQFSIIVRLCCAFQKIFFNIKYLSAKLWLQIFFFLFTFLFAEKILNYFLASIK